MPSIKVTGVIIAKDAEGTISECLQRLADLDEVVVYENGSADRTAEIAGSFANVTLRSGEFRGFGPTKNLAAGYARNDWILSVDSDEFASPALIQSIAELQLSDSTIVYEVHRENYFLGQNIRHSGWGNDWLPRLYNRRTHGYNKAMVHENVVPRPDAMLVRLEGTLEHQAVQDIGQFLVKINRYSELRTQSGGRGYGPLVSLLKSSWAFFRSYVIYLGFLDGWRGVVMAYSNAAGVFFKCIKCYARDHVTSSSSSGS